MTRLSSKLSHLNVKTVNETQATQQIIKTK